MFVTSKVTDSLRLQTIWAGLWNELCSNYTTNTHNFIPHIFLIRDVYDICATNLIASLRTMYYIATVINHFLLTSMSLKFEWGSVLGNSSMVVPTSIILLCHFNVHCTKGKLYIGCLDKVYTMLIGTRIRHSLTSLYFSDIIPCYKTQLMVFQKAGVISCLILHTFLSGNVNFVVYMRSALSETF